MPAITFVATITVDDRNASAPIAVDPPTIETAPDKHIVFVVLNVGRSSHKVSIDRDKFQQKKSSPSDPDGPDTPITFFGKHSDHVEPGDAGAIILRIRDKDNFEPAGNTFKYKYTIEASDLPALDPDIDINN